MTLVKVKYVSKAVLMRERLGRKEQQSKIEIYPVSKDPVR
jgi:hypothetical protein